MPRRMRLWLRALFRRGTVEAELAFSANSWTV